MHHFDGWNTMEGRHLVFAYAAVALIQLGYAGYIAVQWRKVSAQAGHSQASGTKKATKPV